jgi:rubredoxin
MPRPGASPPGRPASDREFDEIDAAALCPSCGLRARHVDREDCIEGLRESVAAIQLQLNRERALAAAPARHRRPKNRRG